VIDHNMGSRTTQLLKLFHNKYFLAGFLVMLPLILMALLGPLFVPYAETRVGNNPTDQQPSSRYLLGTDSYGRDVFAVLVHAIGQSFLIGFIAGGISNIIGLVIGLTGAYRGGLFGQVLANFTLVFMVIPTMPILTVFAAYVRLLTIPQMSILIALFSWSWSARTIRAQTLTLKERDFVSLSRMSGTSFFGIVFKEIMPQMLSFIVTSFIGGIGWAMMNEIAIELIGLGPQNVQTLGWMLYWIMQGGAMIKGMWWWIIPPSAVLIASFVGLQFLNIGLDAVFNPRLRR